MKKYKYNKKIKKFKFAFVALLFGLQASTLIASSALFRDSSQATSNPTPPIVIFDTDMGPDIDDALALAMLHSYHSEGDATLAAVTLSRNSDTGARFIDLVNTFYGRPNVPIGKYFGSVPAQDGAEYHYTGDLVASGTYPHDVHTGGAGGIQEGYKVMRQVLADAPNDSVVLAQVGFSGNTAALLNSPADSISPMTGMELVESKVRYLSVMAGRNDVSWSEFNIENDIGSARTVFGDWPVEIIQSEHEIGYNILYPYSSIQNDFNYVTNHPIKDAYTNEDLSWHDDEPPFYNMRSWDLLSVIAAVEPLDEYYNLGPKGTISVNASGVSTFAANPSGKHQSMGSYGDYSAAERQKIIDRMIELVSRAPGPGSTPDVTNPIITLTGANPQTINEGDSYVELGATANDNIDGNITGFIVINSSAVDTNSAGQYQVTYNVQDAAGNNALQVTRIVNVEAADVPDTTKPVITLTGANPQTITQGDNYVELGATASDNIDGNITGSITINSSAVNTNAVGQYQVTYNVQDVAGNNATQQVRAVDVVAASTPDTTQPTLNYSGPGTITLDQGATYVAPVVTASDNVDGDLTGAIVVSGDTVNVNVPATYTLNYNVIDAALNAADQLTITVVVQAVEETEETEETEEPEEPEVETPVADGDEIDDALENAAPNNGDGNSDGIKDSEQGNVASVPNRSTASAGAYVTLASSSTSTIQSLSTMKENDNDTLDESYDYPIGMFDFTINTTVGATEQIVLHLDQQYDTSNWEWRKYDGSTYSTVDGVVYGEAAVAGVTVTTVAYSIVDGGELDQDGEVNGVIVDPAGPGVVQSDSTLQTLADTGQSYVYIVSSGVLVALFGYGLLHKTLSGKYIRRIYKGF